MKISGACRCGMHRKLTGMNASDVLYYSPGACSLAPHIVLEEIGEPFEARRVAIAEGKHLAPEYLRLNPRGRVPTLVIDGQPVTEAAAILLHLAHRHAALNLLSAGALARARCFEWLLFLASSVHIAYAQLWRPRRFLPSEADAAALISSGRADIVRYNGEIEARIGSGWLLDEGFSIADAYLFPFYRWGVRIGLDMEASAPRWTRWKDRMLDRPAVRRALATEGIGTSWAPA
jgi:glutathione S-transferase